MKSEKLQGEDKNSSLYPPFAKGGPMRYVAADAVPWEA